MDERSKKRSSVRPAEAGDVEFLVRANLGLAEETEGKALDPEVVERGVRAALARPALGRYRVAERGGAVLGSLMLTEEWSDWRAGTYLWIQSVWVEPEARGSGLYRDLWESVLAEARAAEDVCGVRLYVEHDNQRAQAVYEHLGMERLPYHLYACDTPSPQVQGEQSEPAPPSALLGEHDEFVDLVAEHQRALVRGEIALARECFARFRQRFERHAQLEDEVVFPLYAPLAGSIVGGGMELLDAEHSKLARMLDAHELELSRVRAPLAPALLVDWIEREQTLKHLLQHHDQRERNLVYPALDAALDPEARRRLWESVTAWRAAHPVQD